MVHFNQQQTFIQIIWCVLVAKHFYTEIQFLKLSIISIFLFIKILGNYILVIDIILQYNMTYYS